MGANTAPIFFDDAVPPRVSSRAMSSTTAAPPLRETSFFPMGVASRYGRPRGHLDPDTTKSWLRRVLPILRGHRSGFLIFIGFSFASSIFQILAPNVIKNATATLTTAVKNHSTTHASITGSAVELVILGVLAGATGLISRYYMYRTAYDIEFDLRNMIYEHLTKLSWLLRQGPVG